MPALDPVASQRPRLNLAAGTWLALTALAAMGGTASTALAAPPLPAETFYARPLDKVSGGRCLVGDVNDSGQVAGLNDNRTGRLSQGFITGPAGVGATPLQLRKGDHSGAVKVNNLGQVIGWSNLSPGSSSRISFITGPGGVPMQKYDGGALYGINDAGQVVGSKGRWTLYADPATGTLTSLLKDTHRYNEGRDINTQGQVAGRIRLPAANGVWQTHAYVWHPGSAEPLVLALPNATYSTADDLNEWGHAVGTQLLPTGFVHFVADAQGRVRLMGTLDNQPGGSSYGNDINDAGWMVGTSTLSGSPVLHVTLAHEDGPLHDLTPLVQGLPPGVVLHDSPAINNHHQIAAAGTDGLCYLVCPTPDCQPTAP